MNRIYDLKQERANIVNQMRSIMDAATGVLEGDTRDTYNNLEKRFDELNGMINMQEQQLERERMIGEKNPENKGKQIGEAERMNMFAKALSGNNVDVSEYRNAYTLGTTATAGALSAPMEFINQVIKGLDDELIMRQIAHKTPTIGAAESLGFPYRKAEAVDAGWTTEIADTSTANDETTLAYDRREFKPNRLTKMIRISRTLMNHSVLAPGELENEIVRKVSTAQENAYMTGDGSGKPLGIFTASANGITTARDVSGNNTATLITADTLFDAKYALKGQYIKRSQWIGHRDFVKQAAKLKDSNGQYLWQPSFIVGQPDTLLGRPVHMSEFAPNTFAANNYVAVLGDFEYYWICDADEMTIQILNEKYALENQIGYLTNYFGDGAPVLAEAFARVKLGAS